MQILKHTHIYAQTQGSVTRTHRQGLRPSRSTNHADTHTHTLLSENVYEGRSGKDVELSK